MMNDSAAIDSSAAADHAPASSLEVRERLVDARTRRCRLLPDAPHDRRPGESPAAPAPAARRRSGYRNDCGRIVRGNRTVRSGAARRRHRCAARGPECSGADGCLGARRRRVAARRRPGSGPCTGPRFGVVRSGGSGTPRAGYAVGVRRAAGRGRALNLGEHVRLLRRTAGVRRLGGSNGLDARAPGVPSAEHSAQTRRHHRRGSTRAPIRRPVLEY